MNSAQKSVLCVGGAGYVGSAVARYLSAKGWRVTVLDNLSTGFKGALAPEIEFYQGDYEHAASILPTLMFDGIFIFAGRIRVEESMEKPWLYWNENVFKLIKFLKSLPDRSRVIFSSSAAVYRPSEAPLKESNMLAPTSVYGVTKLAAEEAIKHFAAEKKIKGVCLRYFNAAGAEPDGSHGEAHNPETHLIPRLCRYWLGKEENFTVNGADWPTPDGTCVRDFVHILDLAEGHMKALLWLEHSDKNFDTFNLGSGVGHSILEVINVTRRITGKDRAVTFSHRRPGDPPSLVADITKARQELDWSPRYSLEEIIKSAMLWHSERGVYEA